MKNINYQILSSEILFYYEELNYTPYESDVVELSNVPVEVNDNSPYYILVSNIYYVKVIQIPKICSTFTIEISLDNDFSDNNFSIQCNSDWIALNRDRNAISVIVKTNFSNEDRTAYISIKEINNSSLQYANIKTLKLKQNKMIYSLYYNTMKNIDNGHYISGFPSNNLTINFNNLLEITDDEVENYKVNIYCDGGENDFILQPVRKYMYITSVINSNEIIDIDEDEFNNIVLNPIAPKYICVSSNKYYELRKRTIKGADNYYYYKLDFDLNKRRFYNEIMYNNEIYVEKSDNETLIIKNFGIPTLTNDYFYIINIMHKNNKTIKSSMKIYYND